MSYTRYIGIGNNSVEDNIMTNDNLFRYHINLLETKIQKLEMTIEKLLMLNNLEDDIEVENHSYKLIDLHIESNENPRFNFFSDPNHCRICSKHFQVNDCIVKIIDENSECELTENTITGQMSSKSECENKNFIPPEFSHLSPKRLLSPDLIRKNRVKFIHNECFLKMIDLNNDCKTAWIPKSYKFNFERFKVNKIIP